MREKELIEIIKVLRNYEEAADALLELQNLNPKLACTISREILEAKKGDVYFQASALDTLYSLDLGALTLFINANLKDLEHYLILTLLDNLSGDSAIIKDNNLILSLVKKLKKYLKQENSNSESNYSIDWFLETYKSIYI